MKNNNKILVVAVAALAIIGIISGTYAYFTSNASISNSYTATSYSTVVQRDIKDGNWLPGTTISLGTGKDYEKLNVKNTGDTPIIVRAQVTESLVKTGTETTVPLTFTPSGETDPVSAIIINYNSGWKKGTDNYYYYTGVVTNGNPTANLIDSLTFNSAASNNSTCTEVTTENQSLFSGTPVGYVVCTSGADAYDGTTYTLSITFETAQYNIDTWSGKTTELTDAIDTFIGA